MVTFLVALIIYYPGGRSFFSLLSVEGAIALIAILTSIAVGMAWKRIGARYFILTIAACGIGGLGLMYLFFPGVLSTMFDNLLKIFGWNVGTTIMEMQPLLLQHGEFSLIVALGEFTSGLLLGIAGLALVIYLRR